MEKQKLAIFDIDGTFIRSSLLIELCTSLVARGIFPPEAADDLRHTKEAWEERRGPYNSYIMAVAGVFYYHIQGCTVRDLEFVGKMVAQAQKQRVYRFTRALVRKTVANDNYFVVAITGSPAQVARPFVKLWGFDHLVAVDAVEENGIFTGKRIMDAFGGDELSAHLDKTVALQMVLQEFPHTTLEGSIGVGDTRGDSSYLEKVHIPIAFNPDQGLDEIACNKGWRRVVERKNIIWENGTPVPLESV